MWLGEENPPVKFHTRAAYGTRGKPNPIWGKLGLDVTGRGNVKQDPRSQVT